MAILAQRPSHKVRANPVVALLLLSRYPTRVENPSGPDPRIGKSIGATGRVGSGRVKKERQRVGAFQVRKFLWT